MKNQLGRGTLLVNEDGLSMRPPVRIEILSSAENILLLDKDLHEILEDASNSCDLHVACESNLTRFYGPNK